MCVHTYVNTYVNTHTYISLPDNVPGTRDKDHENLITVLLLLLLLLSRFSRVRLCATP